MSRIKPVFKCEDAFKGKFKQSQCLLTISVGQEVHEGEKFDATVGLINSNFGSCIMLVDDSLQRHTMALTQSEDADYFYDTSIAEGDRWLERNEQYFSRISTLTRILRWDEWLKHPLYESQQTDIKKLLDKDTQYQLAFDLTINEFLTRYSLRLDNAASFDMERGRQLCFNYLIEECTALSLWPTLNCHFEVYPNQRNMAMSETHRRFVLPKYPELLHSVAIKFKNRKQLQPQKFVLVADT